MDEELTAFIIKELSKRRSHKDIIQRVCKRSGLNWREAERLIILVEARRRRSMGTPQTPWWLFLSIGVLLVGLGLLAFNLEIVWTFYQQNALDELLNLQDNSFQILTLITGVGMTIAGMISLWRAFGAIFPE